jgi:hypothetical protein
MELAPADLLARLAALSTFWFLLPDQYREILARKIVLCVGLWHLSHTTQPSATTSSSRPLPVTKPQRQVSFGQLEILEFPTLLGDNPSVKEGVPLTMDWKPIHRSIQQVDLVPAKRGPHRKPRALTPTERELVLLSKGYTLRELEQAWVSQSKRGSTPFGNLRNKVKNLVLRA